MFSSVPLVSYSNEIPSSFSHLPTVLIDAVWGLTFGPKVGLVSSLSILFQAGRTSDHLLHRPLSSSQSQICPLLVFIEIGMFFFHFRLTGNTCSDQTLSITRRLTFTVLINEMCLRIY